MYIFFTLIFFTKKNPVLLRRSFEYLHNIFWLKNKKNNFPLHALIWRPVIRQVELGLVSLQ